MAFPLSALERGTPRDMTIGFQVKWVGIKRGTTNNAPAKKRASHNTIKRAAVQRSVFAWWWAHILGLSSCGCISKSGPSFLWRLTGSMD